MQNINSIAIFCGSAMGANPDYRQSAMDLGSLLGRAGIRVVYGGAKVGLMGVVADACLEAGGRVVGVLPHFLSGREIAHAGLSELILVNSMHDRKLKMAELSDGFMALPGGFGTMEEFFEVLTWAQLGLHPKPVGLLNVNGFYDPLITFFEQMEKEQFLKPKNKDLVLAEKNPENLLQQFLSYKAPDVPKWIRKGEE